MRFTHFVQQALVACEATAVATTAFDYIIIGGGTSGITLAERLTTNPGVHVAVIEAGQFSEQTKTLVPELYAGFIGDPTLDWEFVTVPQVHVSNNIISLPRGKTLGGTSAVNGMYFVRASHKEYDAWQTLGNPGWNWSSVDTRIKSIESFTPASAHDAATFHATDSPSNHGTNGPIQTTYSTFWNPTAVIPAYFDTLNALGIPTNKNAAGGETSGVWQAPTSVAHKNRTRSYAVNGFYTPNKGRANLVVFTGATVTKVLTSNSETVHATGVQYVVGNQTATLNVTAKGNVIITAGTYQTPKILELSGIGNATLLKKLGIPVKVDLPSVGENLQDHFTTLTTFKLKDGLEPSVQDLPFNPTFAAEQWQNYLTNRTGVFASVPATTVAFLSYQSFVPSTRLAALKETLDRSLATAYKGSPYEKSIALQRSLLEDSTIPQIEIVLLPDLQDPALTAVANASYVTLAVTNSRPFSRGNVHINTTDPLAHPLIDPNYLGITEFETQLHVEMLKFVLNNITTTAPFSELITQQLGPPPNSTEADLETYVTKNIFSSWHPCGSASMLPRNQGGVVDPNLVVYGTDNIRVADASLIPLEIVTHTQATVYANAVKAAEILQASHQ